MLNVNKKIVFTLIISLITLPVASSVKADGCTNYTEATSSNSATTLTIIDTDVGTEAYQRLLAYSSGGHKALGMAIASEYDYFGLCQYVGVGIMDGRP